MSGHQGYSVAGRINPMRNSREHIGNRTRDVPDCSSVPRATAPPRVPFENVRRSNFWGGGGRFDRRCVFNPAILVSRESQFDGFF